MTYRFETEYDANGSGRIPIDTDYLEAQVPELAANGRHREHYLRRGLQDDLNPTKFFSTDWYAWQNPDWQQEFRSPYLHYLEVGRREGRDPSPFVDMTRFHEATGRVLPREKSYHAILAGLRAPVLGIYESEADLLACQDRFIKGIAIFAHRMTPKRHPRRALVICQAGQSGLPFAWATDPSRDWDLLMNYYDAKGMRPWLGDYVVFQKGTKFTAMKLLTDRFQSILGLYEHVLFIDDDVSTTVGDLIALFAACRCHSLDLAQMALSPGSSCNWPHLFARPDRKGPREVSAVEIMMPVLSRRALAWIAPTLGKSVSGFGLDLIWGRLVSGNGGKIAVLDDISATHTRPVDQADGAFYRYLRQHGINAKAELWMLLKRYGAHRDLVTT